MVSPRCSRRRRPKVRLRSVLKGAGSYFIPFLREAHVVGGTHYAAHCYELFLRHYSYYRKHVAGSPKVVAELGPGSSLGCGLAALLAGADQYFALDLEAHSTTDHDLAVLTELSTFFRARRPPLQNALFPPPAEAGYPPELDQGSDLGRAERIRLDLATHEGRHVRYIAPWNEASLVRPGSVDWLFSHSVLEHVDDLPNAYASMATWLRPGAISTHLIDFDSHELTKEWNGHWAIDRLMWRVIRGKRPYLLNRAWRSQHLDLMRRNGFELLEEVPLMCESELGVEDFSVDYRDMPAAESRVRMTFVVARKLEDR